jgi:hypothetical protein
VGRGPGWRRLEHNWSWNELDWASEASTSTHMSIVRGRRASIDPRRGRNFTSTVIPTGRPAYQAQAGALGLVGLAGLCMAW